MAWVDAPESSPRPLELLAGELVDRFGAQAVYGRPMSLAEMKAIRLAEVVERAYRGYTAALSTDDGSAGWGGKNPELARVAAWAMEASQRDEPDQHRS